MAMDNGELRKTEQLCRSSINAAITKLCEVGTWPQPRIARKLCAGRDFYYKDLQEIEEVNNLIEHLATDDKIKSIYFGPSSKPELHILYDYWERLLVEILYETEGVSPAGRVFKKWFRRFVKELYSDTAVWKAVDTITRLTLNEVELKFDNATVLTSVPASRWVNIIWGEQQYDALLYWGPIGNDKATITTTVRVRKRDYGGFSTPHTRLTQYIGRHSSAIEAIRLTKSGVPRLHCHAQFQLSDFPVSDPLAYCDREGELRLYENETVLDRSDFKTVRTFWHERMNTRDERFLPKHIRSNAMGTAYGRFFSSYTYGNWLDIIVDLTIALEALFSPDESQELKHRISLRAGWLLDLDEQAHAAGNVNNKTYNIVRTMYDIRSSRVHGGTPKTSDIHKWIKTLTGMEDDKSSDSQLVQSALESARGIVRKAIAACVKLSKLEGDGPRWPFPGKFDENIVIAHQRKVWQKAAGIKR